MKIWAFSGEVPKEVIDFIGQQISRIESLVLKKVQLRKPFQCLYTWSWQNPLVNNYAGNLAN